MRRFIITVLIATVLHAVAFEFGRNRAECFFFAFLAAGNLFWRVDFNEKTIDADPITAVLRLDSVEATEYVVL